MLLTNGVLHVYQDWAGQTQKIPIYHGTLLAQSRHFLAATKCNVVPALYIDFNFGEKIFQK